MGADVKTADPAAAMSRMALIVGADLDGVSTSGQVSRSELSNAETRCIACPYPENCAAWLSAQVSQAAPPAFCPNGRLFGKAIRAAIREEMPG